MNEIQWKHSKYGYNEFESYMMVLITGITNFSIIPALIVVRKQGMISQFYIGLFTIITSFMYHVLESLDCASFIINEGAWHRLDNIGSILSFQVLITYLCDLQNLNLEQLINYALIFITFIAQAKAPWDLRFTVGPILFSIFVNSSLIIYKKRLPNLDKTKLKKGIFVVIIAIFFFFISQDEHKDYLRFYHGMWHTCIGIFSFYIWQTKCKETYAWNNFYKLPTKNAII